MNPLLKVDFYKTEHFRMMPEGLTKLYSNLTGRKSRLKGVTSTIFFGLQHFILEYLIKDFKDNFFNKSWEDIDKEYKKYINVNTDHIKLLHDLGYLPLEIKAVDEGTLVPIGVPSLTIVNTLPEFSWLTNYLETLISTSLWQPITSATIANEYRKLLNKYALETTGTTEGVQWQAHDFSLRGMSSIESGINSGMAHLTSFTGTDVIPAIYQLEESYDATGLIGASVPATEHSVMCMGTKDSEIKTFERLLDLYPEGILSVVSDTWDLWKVCTEYVVQLKDKILARNGKLVIRPDSGDPVDIICGILNIPNLMEDNYQYLLEENERIVSDGILYTFNQKSFESDLREYGENDIYSNGLEDYIIKTPIDSNISKGVIELLWDVFGGTINEQGYKVLDSHIGAIYGDSITLERAQEICERLKAKGFASTNIVFGVGSFTYQYNTRDTFGFAIKATYGEITKNSSDPHCLEEQVVECREIFKDPITDDGTKRSAKGLLRVAEEVPLFGGSGKSKLVLEDQQTWEQEATGLLTTVFKDGKLIKRTNLDEIRERIKNG